MDKKRRKPGEPLNATMKAIPLACQDEKAAVEFLEQQRWEGDPACPHCGSVDVYQMKDAKTGERNKRFLWRCHDCRQQFTVRIGTVFEESRIPLRHWAFAFWAACASKKGVSAMQISRQCNLSYKSALFMMHRIRYAMKEDDSWKPPQLKGTVECDEAFVGGKPRRGGPPAKRGLGTNKQPVMALVERGGNMRASVLPTVSSSWLKANIMLHVDRQAKLNTDENVCYRALKYSWPGGHETVQHNINEFSRGDVHVNSAESFFALLKRGLHGTFHSVSKKHLHRYVSEFVFRWNTRKLEDGDRLSKVIQMAEGKRLRYHEPVGA